MMKKLILWILVISCMGTIFFFSSQEASESRKVSSGLIKTFVRVLDFNNKLNEDQIDTIAKNMTFIVRKGAHFSIYAVLCILLSLLLKEYSIFGKWRFILSVLVCFLYACSDEAHQIFVPGRSGEIRDIIIDTCGAITGFLIFSYLTALKNKIKSKGSIISIEVANQ